MWESTRLANKQVILNSNCYIVGICIVFCHQSVVYNRQLLRIQFAFELSIMSCSLHLTHHYMCRICNCAMLTDQQAARCQSGRSL